MMAENSFFSVSSFKATFVWRCGARAWTYHSPGRILLLIRPSTGVVDFSCASYGAMNPWAFWQGNQIRGSGAACHHDAFNSALCGASIVVAQHAEEGPEF